MNTQQRLASRAKHNPAAWQQPTEAPSPEQNDDAEPDLTCPSCGGSGADDWESFKPCKHCDGEGYQWWLA